MQDILEQDYLNVKSEWVLYKALSDYDEAPHLTSLIRFMAMTPEQVEKCWAMELKHHGELVFDMDHIAESVAKNDANLLPEGNKTLNLSFSLLVELTYPKTMFRTLQKRSSAHNIL